jgi:CRISPR-associated protein Cas1
MSRGIKGNKVSRAGGLVGRRELAQYIIGKRKTLDLGNPPANPVGYDTLDYRQTIAGMGYSDWVGMGMNRSTLHYLKKRIKDGKPLNLNRHVKDKLRALNIA